MTPSPRVPIIACEPVTASYNSGWYFAFLASTPQAVLAIVRAILPGLNLHHPMPAVTAFVAGAIDCAIDKAQERSNA